MRKISLNNFLKMSPDVPQYSERNQHYLISGVNPTYYIDGVGTQEEQIAPLIASNTWFGMGFNFSEGNQWVDITSSTDPTYSAYAINKNGATFGLDIFGNTYVNTGVPTGSIVSNASAAKVICYNNNLIATSRISDSNIYKKSLPATGNGGWSSFGTISTLYNEHFLENFLEYCVFSDGPQVRKIDSSWNFLSGINLGTGWLINGMVNYNDKYLAITGSSETFDNNYLFLWNGRDDRYNYSVKIPGRFLDMKVIDCVLYVSVWSNGSGNVSGSGKTTLYYLSGTVLRKVLTPQISNIQSGFKKGIFNFQNRIGLNLYSTDQMIYNKSEVGTEEFVVSTGISFTKFTETYDGFLVGVTSVVGGTNADVYYYNFSSTDYNNILYKSQWVSVKNLDGIDIVYDTPPQTSGDSIAVTIYGRGEDIISGNSTTVLETIIPTNILNTTRTRLDCKGFTGDKVKIELTTTSAGTWRPEIREINLIETDQ